MNNNDKQLIESLRIAAKDLGLNCLIPYKIELENGNVDEYIALIKDFGSSKGTLICSETSCPENDEECSYNLTILACEYYSPYSRDNYIEFLKDLGWFGKTIEKPSWL